MIKEFLDAIQQRLSDGAAWLFAPFQWIIDWWPLLGHFTLFAVTIIVLGFIARFLPDKAKMWLLVLLGFAAAFIAGEVNQYRARLAADRARKLEEERNPPPQPPQAPDAEARWNPFGKW